ncbi:D-alanyl-D-alanine carboxypeptidase, partial [Levilactobacillus brevis]|nr:D-alanyl-D-alanine carboxypeptidase [Levilactobacillus brevis]
MDYDTVTSPTSKLQNDGYPCLVIVVRVRVILGRFNLRKEDNVIMGLKKAKRAIMAVALTAAIGSGVLVGTQATAQAATAYKTVSTKTLTKTAYHK